MERGSESKHTEECPSCSNNRHFDENESFSESRDEQGRVISRRGGLAIETHRDIRHRKDLTEEKFGGIRQRSGRYFEGQTSSVCL